MDQTLVEAVDEHRKRLSRGLPALDLGILEERSMQAVFIGKLPQVHLQRVRGGRGSEQRVQAGRFSGARLAKENRAGKCLEFRRPDEIGVEVALKSLDAWRLQIALAGQMHRAHTEFH